MTKIHLHINDLPQDISLGNTIAIDTETMGLHLNRDRLCLLQIKGENSDIHLVQFINNNYDCPNLKNILSNKETLKIFHYARFDVLAIHKYLKVMCVNIFCTKIASKLVRTYTDKHSLKELCKELLNIDIIKEQQSSDWGSVNLSEGQKLYAGSDVLHLHNIQKILEERLIRENRLDLARSCFDFLPTKAILDDMEFSDNNDIFNH